ncbi:MAG: molybdenum cofactor guanylyltransferase [Aureliella sp.]
MLNSSSAEEPSQLLHPANCPAYIMAGGRSSRFGSDKARVEIASEPLLLALRRCMSQAGHAVEIVADRADRYENIGLQCLVDQQSGQGPLAGVATALQHREQQRPGWLLLVSCDLFVWKPEWFEKLAKKAMDLKQDSDGTLPQPACDSIAFVSDSKDSDTKDIEQGWEPFPSLLHTRLLLQVLANLQRGQYSLQTLFRTSRAVGIESSDNPQAWTFNTPEQLRALRPGVSSH